MRKDEASDILDQNRKCFGGAKGRRIRPSPSRGFHPPFDPLEPSMTSAQSFSFAGADPDKAARALAQAARRVTKPSGAMVFAAGALGEKLVELSRAAARAMPGVPVCLVAGAGVVSERG